MTCEEDVRQKRYDKLDALYYPMRTKQVPIPWHRALSFYQPLIVSTVDGILLYQVVYYHQLPEPCGKGGGVRYSGKIGRSPVTIAIIKSTRIAMRQINIVNGLIAYGDKTP